MASFMFAYYSNARIIRHLPRNLNKCINKHSAIDFKHALLCVKTSELNYLSKSFHIDTPLSIKIVRANKEGEIDYEKIGISQYTLDDRILYNSNIDSSKQKMPFGQNKRIEQILKDYEIKLKYENSVPLIIEQIIKEREKMSKNIDTRNDVTTNDHSIEEDTHIEPFPFLHTERVSIENIQEDYEPLKEPIIDWKPPEITVAEDIAKRLKAYNAGKLDTPLYVDPKVFTNKDRQMDYLLEHLEKEESIRMHKEGINKTQYGTPKTDVPASRVPCGGCGAKLHCQDTALPGYMPSERFLKLSVRELSSTICQRCYLLKYHNIALNVRVSPEDYIKLLNPIKKTHSLAIVLVDLLDMPCSIWPGILDIIGTRIPVIVVGNKVDLLPADGPEHLQNIMLSLEKTVESTDLWQTNIKDMVLISAATGYGIEEFISKLQANWSSKGDIYIIGCTNSGKSTLYNALLGSDLCSSKARDLVMRATSSPWPGTTLNLLKFPMMVLTGQNLSIRLSRLSKQFTTKQRRDDDQARYFPPTQPYTTNINIATLSGHVEPTFTHVQDIADHADPFAIETYKVPSDIKLPTRGINRKHTHLFEDCQWCYDTPGTVNPQQITDLLTHDELLKVIPRQLIVPRTFSLLPTQSLLIAGIARIDLLYTNQKLAYLTVFASNKLPITVVKTTEASSIHRTYLGTKLFEVPCGDEDRMSRFPPLEPQNVSIIGKGFNIACCDVVLSSAGWISIAGLRDSVMDFRAWSPNGRGINVRKFATLPRTVQLKGSHITKTPVHLPHKLYIPQTTWLSNLD